MSGSLSHVPSDTRAVIRDPAMSDTRSAGEGRVCLMMSAASRVRGNDCAPATGTARTTDVNASQVTRFAVAKSLMSDLVALFRPLILCGGLADCGGKISSFARVSIRFAARRRPDSCSDSGPVPVDGEARFLRDRDSALPGRKYLGHQWGIERRPRRSSSPLAIAATVPAGGADASCRRVPRPAGGRRCRRAMARRETTSRGCRTRTRRRTADRTARSRRRR